MFRLANLRKANKDDSNDNTTRSPITSSKSGKSRQGPIAVASKLGNKIRNSMSDSPWVLAGEGAAATAVLYGGLRLSLGAYRCAPRARAAAWIHACTIHFGIGLRCIA